MSSVLYQIRLMSRKRTVKAIFWLLTAAVMLHYVVQVRLFWGKDIANLYEPMKLRLMANSTDAITFRLMQFYPLLVVIPAGFSYVEDRENYTDVYIRGRIGNRQYIYSKMIAAFVVSFLVFTIPFLLELLLYIIAFPLTATGDPSNISDYQAVMQEIIGKYLFSEIYVKSSLLYGVTTVFLWGILAGVLGGFTACISMLGIRFRALLFLPVYVLLYFVSTLENIFCTPYTTNYLWYIQFYDFYVKTEWGLVLFILIIIIISVMITLFMGRRDWRK